MVRMNSPVCAAVTKGEARLLERINVAIIKKDFERMARYGRNATKAVVVVYPRAAVEAVHARGVMVPERDRVISGAARVRRFRPGVKSNSSFF